MKLKLLNVYVLKMSFLTTFLLILQILMENIFIESSVHRNTKWGMPYLVPVWVLTTSDLWNTYHAITEL